MADMHEELKRLREADEAAKASWREETTATLKELGRTLNEMNTILHTTAKQAEATSTALRGPNPPHTDITYRMARVEECQREHLAAHESNRKWFLGIVGAWVVMAGTYLWDLIKKP